MSVKLIQRQLSTKSQSIMRNALKNSEHINLKKNMQLSTKGILLFLVVSVLISSVQCLFDVIINEIQIVDPKKPEKKEFIELKSTSDSPNIALRGYKLIGFNCQSKTGTIDLVVTLWNQRMDKNGLFTIGGSDVSTANLKIPNEFTKCKSEFVGKQTISNLFGQKEVRAIGLLHDKNNAFSNIILSKKTPNIKIDDGITNQLRNYLVGLVVYGDNACEKCSLFEKINDDFASKKYILREFPNSEKKLYL